GSVSLGRTHRRRLGRGICAHVFVGRQDGTRRHSLGTVDESARHARVALPFVLPARRRFRVGNRDGIHRQHLGVLEISRDLRGMKWFSLLLSASTALAAPPASPGNGAERARALKDYLAKEKQNIPQRELERRDLLDELDQLNAEQNQVRRKLANITANR